MDRKSDRKNTAVIRNVVIAGVIILAIVGFSFFFNDTGGYQKVDTSVAMAELDRSNVKEATVKDREQQLQLTLKEQVTPPGSDKATDKIMASYPDGASEQVFDRVARALPEKYNTEVTQPSILKEMASFLLPMLILFALIFFFMSRMQGGKGGLFGVGKSRAVEVTKDMPKTTFADVAGEDEAVEELNEIKDFLQNPARYERLGAKIPRGVLLYGPPGTGKTLLARAVAGEAGVPFYSISGSDFVEMFVGVGASRVRDLFEKAKQNSPCIVFVDEIDAVGRHRGSGMGGGHDEREQTLNQLLVEMDGFDDRSTVILIAATNRPDVLDPALLRPGRFDRQVPVTNPDLKGREAILAVHSTGKPLAPEVNLNSLAKRTIGMSGADLANVLNEGALLAARLGRDTISNDILEEATDRVVGGPRRKHRVISEHEKKVTAYHESGHALAAWAMEDLEPVHKVTILARGKTGGHALVVPEDDKSLLTRADMLARIVMAMGGRAAEEYIFGEPTSGASSDIESATNIARAMVTEYGMSSRLGAVRFGDDDGDPFSGRGGGANRGYSDEVARAIDEEVHRIIEAAHTEAWKVLEANREVLDRCAGELLEKETLRQDDLERIFVDVTKRPRISEFDDFGDRTPSTDPPIKTPGELAKERGEPWPPEDSDPFAQSFMPAPPVPASPAGSGWPGSDDGRGGRDGSGPSGPEQAYPAAPRRSGGTPQPAGRPSGPAPVPQYGTPPPPGWSAPGWPPREGPRYGGGPAPQPVSPPAPREHSQPVPREHPHSGQSRVEQPQPRPSGSEQAYPPATGQPLPSPRPQRTPPPPSSPTDPGWRPDPWPEEATRPPDWGDRGTPPSSTATTRLPAAGATGGRPGEDRTEPGTTGGHRRDDGPVADSTRAWSAAPGPGSTRSRHGRSGSHPDDGGPHTGSHRREDRDDRWTAPWERRDER